MGPLSSFLHITTLLIHSLQALSPLPAGLSSRTSARGLCAEAAYAASFNSVSIQQYASETIHDFDQHYYKAETRRAEKELFSTLLAELGIKDSAVFTDLLAELDMDDEPLEHPRVAVAEERMASITEDEVMEALGWDWPASPKVNLNVLGECTNADRGLLDGMECDRKPWVGCRYPASMFACTYSLSCWTIERQLGASTTPSSAHPVSSL